MSLSTELRSTRRSLRRAADLSRGPPRSLPGAVCLTCQQGSSWCLVGRRRTLKVCSITEAGRQEQNSDDRASE